MSYENAEPKILKSLNSAGQVLNDSGEVIGESSDYWQRIYNQAEPKPDKILHSDGTIKDSAGNLIQDTTPFNVKKYTQAEPIPAKYLHADGTVDESPDIKDYLICCGNYGFIASTNNFEKFWKVKYTPLTFSSTIVSITYSKKLNLYIASSSGGEVLTSSDGETWTSQKIINQALQTTCYSEKLNVFLVSGLNGVIFSSPDGITWTGIETLSGAIQKIISEKDLLVAVGEAGVYVSSDGENWVNKYAPGATVKCVTYSEKLGLFVAVGQGFILTSPDGETWTSQAYTGSLRKVYYGNNLFIITGGGGTILTSPDGENWTQQTSGVSGNNDAIVYSKKLNKYIIGGSSGINLTSPDGITWTKRDKFTFTLTFSDIISIDD